MLVSIMRKIKTISRIFVIQILLFCREDKHIEILFSVLHHEESLEKPQYKMASLHS